MTVSQWYEPKDGAMHAGSETLISSGETYTATCPAHLVDVVQPYIDAVDEAFPTLKGCYGREPKILKFDVEVLKEHKLDAKGRRIPTAFVGRDRTGTGKINFVCADPKTRELVESPTPQCLCGGLVFETTHGFLFQARRARDKDNNDIEKNRLGEPFSAIIPIEFLKRIGHPKLDYYRAGGGWKEKLGPYFHPWQHYPEALIYQTSDSLDRMLGRKHVQSASR